MKFLKENWYKLMTGTAMLIFACGFFIYAVGPSYANQTSEVNKPQMESNDDKFAVASGGYLYTWESREFMIDWARKTYEPGSNSADDYWVQRNKPTKRKLP